ncbi:MAG TPA: FlgD immunoglobulin-like domain containing protein [Candidatus Cloacimonadota bacterium]|nr:FlgD immunoglobulin-like domain containing protein [Candidatus Cloacimonadota bacterium]
MNERLVLALSLAMLFTSLAAYSPSSGDYRSAEELVTGSWEASATWELYDGAAWEAAVESPSYSSGVIHIRSGATVTMSTSIQVDEFEIDAGGVLVVDSLITLSISSPADDTEFDMIIHGILDIFGTLNIIRTANRYANVAVADGGELNIYGTLNTQATGQSHNETDLAVLSLGKVFLGDQCIVTGEGNVILTGDAIFEIAHADGLSSSNGFKSEDFIVKPDESGNYPTFIYSGDEPGMVTGDLLPAAVGNLIINNPNGVTLTNDVEVLNTLVIESGSIDYAGFDVTFESMVSIEHYFAIIDTDVQISEISVFSTTPTAYPVRIDRQWTISGSWDESDLLCKFSWNAEEDHFYDWNSSVDSPVIYNGEIALEAEIEASLDTDPRWLEVYITSDPGFSVEGITIGLPSGHTLPVSLSSFSAFVRNQSEVIVRWATQSETNLSGFIVYRNNTASFAGAQSVGVLVLATNTSQLQTYQMSDVFDIERYESYYYWLESIDIDGSSNVFGPISVCCDTENHLPEIPIQCGINCAYPNPFNSHLNLQYGITKSGQTELVVCNCKGQLIRSLNQGYSDIGAFSVSWDGRDDNGHKLPSGWYLILLHNDGKTYWRKVSMLK